MSKIRQRAPPCGDLLTKKAAREPRRARGGAHGVVKLRPPTKQAATEPRRTLGGAHRVLASLQKAGRRGALGSPNPRERSFSGQRAPASPAGESRLSGLAELAELLGAASPAKLRRPLYLPLYTHQAPIRASAPQPCILQMPTHTITSLGLARHGLLYAGVYIHKPHLGETTTHLGPLGQVVFDS